MPETMAGQVLPETVIREGRWLRRRTNLTALAVRRILRERGGLSGLDTAILPVSLTVEEFQRQAAQRSASHTPAIMASMGYGLPDADYIAATDEFAGVLGDGTSVVEGVSGVFSAARSVARTSVVGSELYRQYLETSLLRLSRTAVADTYRAVQQVTAHGIYPHVGYIRALTPPSCGRCVLLAGQESGPRPFERHPNCDCIAVPVPLDKYGERIYDGNTDLSLTEPEEYLNSLSDHDLARTLGSKANAQAYKDGADYIQIVNAYRRKGYVRAASDGSKSTLLNGYLSREQMVKAGMGHYDARNRPRADVPRLMPETIYRNASSPEEAKQLLYDYGWIRPVWDPASDTMVRPQL